MSCFIMLENQILFIFLFKYHAFDLKTKDTLAVFLHRSEDHLSNEHNILEYTHLSCNPHSKQQN